MDFYDKLLFHKVTEKISYKELGKTVHMTADAIRMAIERRSLSLLQKGRLQEVYNFGNEQRDDLNETPVNYKTGLEKYHPLEIVEYIYKKKDSFFSLLSFRELVKDDLLDKKVLELEEEIKSLKNKMKTHLRE